MSGQLKYEDQFLLVFSATFECFAAQQTETCSREFECRWKQARYFGIIEKVEHYLVFTSTELFFIEVQLLMINFVTIKVWFECYFVYYFVGLDS